MRGEKEQWVNTLYLIVIKNNLNFGFGNIEFNVSEEILDFDDINQISEIIKEEENFEEVVILNYKKLSKEREEK